MVWDNPCKRVIQQPNGAMTTGGNRWSELEVNQEGKSDDLSSILKPTTGGSGKGSESCPLTCIQQCPWTYAHKLPTFQGQALTDVSGKLYQKSANLNDWIWAMGFALHGGEVRGYTALNEHISQ